MHVASQSRYFLIILSLLILLSVANAKIVLYKETPNPLPLNKSFNITFVLMSIDESKTVHCRVIQQFSNVTPVSGNFSTVNSGPVSLVSYSFEVNVPPNKTVTYPIIISLPYMPISGKYTIPEAMAICDNKEYRDIPLVVKVECNNNRKCESKLGENPYNCPGDCYLGEVVSKKMEENIVAKYNQSQQQNRERGSPSNPIAESQEHNPNYSNLLGILVILFAILIALVILLARFFIQSKTRSKPKKGKQKKE